MAQADNVLPVSKEDIARTQKVIDTFLCSGVSFNAAASAERVSVMAPQLAQIYQKYMSLDQGNDRSGAASSIMQSLKRFSDSPGLPSVNSAVVANTIKYGYALGGVVAGMYAKACGLAMLRNLNGAGNLNPTQKGEFQQKQVSEAAVMLFSSAYYIVSELSKYKTEEVSARVIPNITFPEFSIMDGKMAISFSLFYYEKFMAPEIVHDDVDLVKFSIDYFTAILSELNVYKHSLQYVTEFEEQSYKLDGTDFVIRGFNSEMRNTVTTVEFKRVLWPEVVGNRENKHAQTRLVQTLLCYDKKTKMNPMVELGGSQTVTAGLGPPGTGKSMEIAATATELYDRCKDLGIQFLFWPFPPNPVSEYQGGSSQRVLDWFRPLKDHTKIIYAPIDDAENNLVSRGNRSTSSGNREVISIFLTETEGASAIIRGNYAIQLFTNRPEDLDSAVLSRIQKRSVIAGAETWQDFLDQDYNWWKKYNEYRSDFVGLQKPDDYNYFDNQRMVSSLSALYKGDEEALPKNETVRNIFLAIQKNFDPEKDDKFYGLFYEQVKKTFPFFTSRDIRNIQMAVSSRIMDFDFPQEWLNDNGIFFAKEYDVKKNMLIEQMKVNMKGLSFARLRREEAIKYIDITVAINETAYETSVKEQLERRKINEEAEKRFLAGK